MNKPKRRTVTSAKDIAAFVKTEPDRAEPVTDRERKDELLPKPLVKIVNCGTGNVIQASLPELNQQMREFRKVILLIEDEASAAGVCAEALHQLGHDGVQLITQLMAAEQHLADIVSGLTEAPFAIVLDLGLGNDSGFSVLRICHAEPKLQKIPILVWTKHSDDLSEKFSNYLGAKDFLIKSSDERELRAALKGLLAADAA